MCWNLLVWWIFIVDVLKFIQQHLKDETTKFRSQEEDMVPYIVLKMNAKIPERFYDEVLEDLEKNGRKLIIKFLDYDEPIIIEMTE